MRLTAGQAVVEAIERFGVDRVFGIPGVHTLEIYDALTDSDVDHVSGAHEGSIVRAATAAARLTNDPSVAVVSAGPGAINSMAGVGEARSLGAPLVVIAGAEPRRDGLHNVTDPMAITGMYRSIAKECLLLTEPGDIIEALRRGFRIAQAGKPGPVVVHIPKDVLVASAAVDLPVNGCPAPEPAMVDEAAARTVIERIRTAEAPVIVAGQGARRAGPELVGRLADRLDAPVVVTYRGYGSYADRPRYAGLFTPGVSHASAEEVIAESDLLIGIGVQEGTRRQLHDEVDAETCYLIEEIERYELGLADVTGDLASAIETLTDGLTERRDGWWRGPVTAGWERTSAGSPFDAPAPGERYQPRDVVEAVSGRVDDDAVLVTDVGIHGSATMYHFDLGPANSTLHPENWGAMGHAIPSAIGAKIAAPDRQVVALEGDGSMLMNATEFTTAVGRSLDVTVVVLDNAQHNAVYLDQHRAYGRSNYTAVQGLDYAAYAESAGGTGFTVGPADGLGETIEAALDHVGPTVVSVPTAADVRLE